jgi:hypothetical protein
MIKINEMTRGRFGNRVLQYNALVQLAAELGHEASCVAWEGNEIFKNMETHKTSSKPNKHLTWKDISFLMPLGHFPPDLDYTIGPYCIHNVFWQVSKRDPREFFEINDKYRVELSKEKTHVGIHLRGTDIIEDDGNHGREVHPPDYYKRAIDFVEENSDNTIYHICTDDRTFPSYKETIAYLDEKGLPYELGSTEQFVDFSTLTECDIIIATSSTFVVCAAMIGKKDKKVIHWEGWKNLCVNHVPWHKVEDPPHIREWQMSFDNFWVNLFTEETPYYNLWRVL